MKTLILGLLLVSNNAFAIGNAMQGFAAGFNAGLNGGSYQAPTDNNSDIIVHMPGTNVQPAPDSLYRPIQYNQPRPNTQCLPSLGGGYICN